ncbi:AraC family transcriptional regulator [Granulosicoccaceae sp. 1_MG-2023]|nr:AraC family transcriptional regulator [Granulosicoccaceae sp. 1_MG-2023]
MSTEKNVTVTRNIVQHLLDHIRDQGFDVHELLAQVGLSEEDVQNSTELPAEQFGQLYQRAMYVAQDEYFGMLSGGKVPNGTFRMMCHAIISCRSLGHAIARASDFHEIVKGTRIKPKLERRGRYAKMSFGGIDSLTESELQALINNEAPERICISLSMWHHFISWLVGERVELKAAYFTFPESRALPGNRARFQSEVKFLQHDNAIVFPARYLDYAIVQTEETLRGFLKTAPYQLLVMVDDDVSLKAQVVALLGRDFSLSPPSAEKVAQTLNMSVSTLRRRLLEEGTTYQKIKDECRRRSAIRYMNSPQLSINDVAELMGFDEPSAFFRSFKRWTGMTPGQYRASPAYRQALNESGADDFQTAGQN